MNTQYWHPLKDGRIQCDLCPHACKLKEGGRGRCFVRACQKGSIVLTTYGRSSGFAIDPVEKKPLYHFLPGTPILSFGTAGCNLACQFCQNWDISHSREMDTLAAKASPKQIAEAACEKKCASVAMTYNEPVIFHEYAIDTAKACRALGIRTVAVTAGYVNPKPREEFYEWMDAANVDLKSFSDSFYQKYTGAHLGPVLDTLLYIRKKTRTWLEITTLLIPGLNDCEKKIRALASWIAGELGPTTPLHLSAFHPAWKMMDRLPTPPETILKARDIALKQGLFYVYSGNIIDSKGSHTYCKKCGKKIIGREGYEITEQNLTEKSACRFCQTTCDGVFN